MTPVVTGVRMSGARHRAELPLLVLGPSLGTRAGALWTDVRAAPGRRLRRGRAGTCPATATTASVPDEPFTMAELAEGVLRVVDDILEQRGEPAAPFAYAGDSVGGAVGLQLLLDHPDRVTAAVLLCTGARIGDAADLGRPGRPGPRLGHAGPGAALRRALVRPRLPGARARARPRAAARARGRRRRGYVQVCGALAALRRPRPARRDHRRRCWRSPARTTRSRPPDLLREIADGVQRRPARRPRRRRAPGAGRGARGRGRRDSIRRARAGRGRCDAGTASARRWRSAARCSATRTSTGRLAGATDLTRDFQELITEYAWGGDLDPARPRPAQPLDDHAHRPGRPRPPRGAGAARARRPHATA